MLALTCAVDLVLPPGSLYILCNSARYEMAHSVLPQEHASRRLSIVLRDAPAPSAGD